jgi:hypothetical protein
VHIPKSCDDGNPCTDDACNSSTVAPSPKICDDENPALPILAIRLKDASILQKL